MAFHPPRERARHASATGHEASARTDMARDTSPWELLRTSTGRSIPAGTPIGGATAPVDVKVHSDAAAGAVARSWDAEAFTLGRNVYFAPGALRTGTAPGR